LIINENVFTIAAGNGHLKVLEWLHNNNCPFDKNKCMNAATESGNFKVVKWLYKIGCTFNEVTFNHAAKGGNIKILEWLKINNCVWSTETCKFAVYGRNLKALQWLHSNGCPWDYGTFYAARQLENENEIIKWLWTTNCPTYEVYNHGFNWTFGM
jgi:hypothetical protein